MNPRFKIVYGIEYLVFFSVDYLSNLTLPLYGLKIFHMDAANMFPDDSMMITSAPSIPDVLVPYQFFLPKSISYYFSRKRSFLSRRTTRQKKGGTHFGEIFSRQLALFIFLKQDI